MECLLPRGEALVGGDDQSFCLVANAVPGDTVACELVERRRGVWRGRLTEVLSPSPERVSPPCDVADACGGCALQPLAPEAHAALKSGWVRDAFRDYIETDTAWLEIKGSTSPASLRRRARWWRGEDTDGVFLGFRARNSHRVVRQSRCMAVRPEMDAVCRGIEGMLPGSVASVQLSMLADGMHAVLEGENDPPDGIDRILAAAPGMTIQWWWRTAQGTTPLQRPVRVLHDHLPAGDGSVRLIIGPDDFIQGCEAGNTAMVGQVQQWAEGARRVVDLFSGAGNLSLPLACGGDGITVLGAELDPASVRHANRNAAELGADARYVQADLFGAVDTEAFSGADLLILDPPRKGAKAVCRRMTTLLPSRIVMINCDVAAGARDAAELHRAGYRLRALRGLDLFPYAGHVEAMSLWAR